jgi:seryl-tRNA synthetase
VNPQAVKENIKKKFQDTKLSLVDEVLELDTKWRKERKKADDLRSERNKISEEINKMIKAGKKDDAKDLMKEAKAIPAKIEEAEKNENELGEKIKEKMMRSPNIIHDSVPIGKDDKENVVLEVLGEPKFPSYEVFNHVELAEKNGWVDLDSSRKTSGNGFYYLKGDLARLHSAILTYARDFMIDKGFTYCVPPFMIRADVCYRRYEF